MAALDYNYLTKLTVRAKTGDSDAFAEIYAATYQRQYSFSCQYLKDRFLAQDALQETYIIALENISKLKEPTLLIAWLNQINFRVCYRLQQKRRRYESEMQAFDADGESQGQSPEAEIVEIDSRQYIMNQILSLPFTESQVIIMKYYNNTSHDDIARLMDISRASVNRYLKSGKERLKKLLQE